MCASHPENKKLSLNVLKFNSFQLVSVGCVSCASMLHNNTEKQAKAPHSASVSAAENTRKSQRVVAHSSHYVSQITAATCYKLLQHQNYNRLSQITRNYTRTETKTTTLLPQITKKQYRVYKPLVHCKQPQSISQSTTKCITNREYQSN